MPRYVGNDDGKTIQADWWAEQEVCVIKRFGYGDRQYLAGQTVKMDIKPGQDEMGGLVDVQIGEMNLAILERGIVRWTDEEGNDVPVTRELIERLQERDAEFILAEINAYNPRRRRSAEDQKGFRGGSGGSDQE